MDKGASPDGDRATRAAHEAPAGLRHPAGIPSAFTVAELAAALANFPANGKPPMDDIHFDLVILGFIERRDITKSCRSCGTALADYSYLKLTAGGRMFLAAAQAIEARRAETGTGSVEDESAVAKPCAPTAAPTPSGDPS